ncbi:MAG: glycosyltransferase family 2 protein [Saprospiraceae bacterium]|nr:glycosyltransferase family 2 protein [Saprospiraceae bacterium]MDW8484175.1 glycosyltransferase family 2 protein [Saprospiraceae bacterium]
MKNASKPRIAVIIPAFNEEDALPFVLATLPKNWVQRTIVCDNGSTDRTAEIARLMGATVVRASRRGYGSACLAGIAYLKQLPREDQPEVVVFLDADYADDPNDLPKVAGPVLEGSCDLVIGSRLSGKMEPGAMSLPQRFGNWLASLLIRLFFGKRFTDLGPFRAIRWDRLQQLNMRDTNYGWTVEMQIKAVLQGLCCAEVPVNYRRRVAGRSKVSGTLRGVVLAGTKILSLIFWHYLQYSRQKR